MRAKRKTGMFAQALRGDARGQDPRSPMTRKDLLLRRTVPEALRTRMRIKTNS